MMNREQLKAARTILNRHPELKVTIGRVEAGETLTPYFADDVFRRGDEVLVTANMPPAQITSLFGNACLKLKAAEVD
jgi:hypothetical protein